MSTAVDTAFADLMSANGEGLEPLHVVCLVCHPTAPSPGIPAICGVKTKGSFPTSAHQHRCAKCVALDFGPWPCGH